MSRRVQALERRCAVGLACTHSGLQDRILLNYVYYIEVQQTFTVVSLFPG